jgi:hypothetical protein
MHNISKCILVSIVAKNLRKKRVNQELVKSEAFHIYENWHAGPRKAIIHGGSCGTLQRWQGQIGRI